MKTTCVLFLFIGITANQSLLGQSAIAGLTDGANVVYVDPDDIELSVDDEMAFDHESYALDIDQDGNSDLTFHAHYYYFSHPDVRGTQTEVEPDAFTYISKLDSTEYAIHKHMTGDTIGAGLNWFPHGMAMLNNYSTSGATEYFVNEGYVGFRICRTDTIYGWVRVLAQGAINSAQLTIYDYAYVARPNAIEPADNHQQVSCTLLDNNRLCLDIPDDDNFGSRECWVFDFTGRMLKEARLTTGRNYLSLADLRSGVYLVTIQTECGIRQTFKILKP